MSEDARRRWCEDIRDSLPVDGSIGVSDARRDWALWGVQQNYFADATTYPAGRFMVRRARSPVVASSVPAPQGVVLRLEDRQLEALRHSLEMLGYKIEMSRPKIPQTPWGLLFLVWAITLLLGVLR